MRWIRKLKIGHVKVWKIFKVEAVRKRYEKLHLRKYTRAVRQKKSDASVPGKFPDWEGGFSVLTLHRDKQTDRWVATQTGAATRSVLHTTITWSVLYSLSIEIALDIIRKLTIDSNGVETRHKVLNSKPSGHPGRTRSSHSNKTFEWGWCTFSDDVFIVLKMEHRLTVRASLISKLVHALHHSAEHTSTVELWRWSSSL